MSFSFCIILKLLTVTLALGTPPLQIENLPKFYDTKPTRGRTRGATENELNTLLPPSLNPESYQLKIRPILYPEGSPDEWTAPGSVKIFGTAVAPVDQIVLHRYHETLRINSASILVKDENRTVIPWVSVEESSNTYSIRLERKLTPGLKYTIFMSFIAQITSSTQGLYRVYYDDEDGEQRRMAITQLEETNARRVFPCFDEPRFKSKFTISIARRTADANYFTLSNTDKIVTNASDPELPSGWVYDHYRETKPMSAYLVAIVVTDYSYREAPAGIWKKQIRIYGPEKQINKLNGADYAAATSAKVVKKLEEIFEFKYEMPKLDAIAVSNDYFQFGGMENWGLITYMDKFLMYYKGESQEQLRKQISSLITHEIAHQWLGNLVTCKYWSQIWLNEGFTNYMEQIGLSEVYPEFKSRRLFLVEEFQNAMAVDVGYKHSILIQPEDLDNTGFVVVYSKAASLLRMMEGFLGFPTFRKSIVKYLRKFAYQSVDQDDFFNHVDKYAQGRIPAGNTIKQIMDPWTMNRGYPLVRVLKDGDQRLIISQIFERSQAQERFLEADTSQSERTDQLWHIPIPIVTENSSSFSNHTPTLWLDSARTTFAHDTSKWILLNPDAFGFYRVLYDEDLFTSLISQLQRDRIRISGLSRSQLIDDYFHFARLGHVPIATALETTKFLDNEDDFVVWFSMFNGLQRSLLPLSAHEFPRSFKEYLAPKIDAALDIISWDQGRDVGTSVMYRAKLADWACALGSDGCARAARKTLSTWKRSRGRNPVALDLQPVLYCAVAAHGGEEALDHLLEQLAKAEERHKKEFLRALPCLQDSKALYRLLSLTLDTASELSNHTEVLLFRLARAPVGRKALTDFLLDKFDEIEAHAGPDSVVYIVGSVMSSVTSEMEFPKLQRLIMDKRVLQERFFIVSRVLQTLSESVAQKRKVAKTIESWLGNQQI